MKRIIISSLSVVLLSTSILIGYYNTPQDATDKITNNSTISTDENSAQIVKIPEYNNNTDDTADIALTTGKDSQENTEKTTNEDTAKANNVETPVEDPTPSLLNTPSADPKTTIAETNTASQGKEEASDNSTQNRDETSDDETSNSETQKNSTKSEDTQSTGVAKENTSSKNDVQKSSKTSSSQKAQSSQSSKKSSEKTSSTNKTNKKNKTSTSSSSSKKSSSSSTKKSHFSNMITTKAGADGDYVGTFKGEGTIQMVFTTNSKTAAPGLPTYVSMMCPPNGSVYSAAFNTSKNETVVKTVPFSGECRLKVKTAYPTSKWKNTYNAVNVSYGDVKYVSGTGYAKKATWNSKVVSKESTFTMQAPKKFSGNVIVKLTGCSTNGGATDATITDGCDGLVQRNVKSTGTIEIFNNGKKIKTQNFNISAKKHHETFTIPVSRLSSDNLVIKVRKDSGPAVIVHGPGSSVVGTY